MYDQSSIYCGFTRTIFAPPSWGTQGLSCLRIRPRGLLIRPFCWLCEYDHRKTRRANRQRLRLWFRPTALSFGRLEIHALTALNKLEHTQTYFSSLSQLPSGEANACRLGSASWATPGARWRMNSHKISTTYNPFKRGKQHRISSGPAEASMP